MEDEEDNATCALKTEQHAATVAVYVACSLVAVVGILCNVFLLTIFVRKLRSIRDANQFLYQTLLAIMDALICFTYIANFSVRDVMYFFGRRWLYLTYFVYCRLMTYVGRVDQWCMPYTLVFAAIERWIYITNQTNCLRFIVTKQLRVIITGSILLVGIVIMYPYYAYTVVEDFPLCDDVFRSKEIHLNITTDQQEKSYHIFDGIVLGLQSFVPFCVLLLVNILIIRKLRTTHNEIRRKSLFVTDSMWDPNRRVNGTMFDVSHVALDLASTAVGEHQLRSIQAQLAAERRRLRGATSTLVVIVSSHLLVNTVACVMYVWDHMHPATRMSAVSGHFHTHYIVMADVLSFMVMLSSALRLTLYYTWNHELRTIINAVVCGAAPAAADEDANGNLLLMSGNAERVHDVSAISQMNGERPLGETPPSLPRAANVAKDGDSDDSDLEAADCPLIFGNDNTDLEEK